MYHFSLSSVSSYPFVSVLKYFITLTYSHSTSQISNPNSYCNHLIQHILYHIYVSTLSELLDIHDGGNRFLRNVGMAQDARRLESSSRPLWEPQISHIFHCSLHFVLFFPCCGELLVNGSFRIKMLIFYILIFCITFRPPPSQACNCSPLIYVYQNSTFCLWLLQFFLNIFLPKVFSYF